MTSSNDNRRARFLEEMGVGPSWTLRARHVAPAVEQVAAAATPTETAVPAMADAGTIEAAWPAAAPDPAPSMMSAMPSAAISTAPSAAEIAQMDWQQLQAAVAVCTKCRLCQTRTHTVFGTGTPKARWLFVGEGPGYNEDLQGEPFIGPAGKLLDNMLAAMGLRRGVNAFIANIVKCRPTDASGRDRPPEPDEAAACQPYLERQITLIQPSIIVALGKTAGLALLGQPPDTPVSKLRGIVHRHADRPLVVTYHPAYLLRKPEDKDKVWRDLCLAMNTDAGISAPA